MNNLLHVTIFLLISFNSQRCIDGQATGISQVDNIASSIINQLNTLSRQITSAQSVASELSRSIASMVATSTRLVQGLQAENATDNRDNNGQWAGITSSFVDQAMANPFVVILSNQVNQLQRALTDISLSVQRMIDSGSRIITGAPYANAPETLDNDAVTTAASTEAPVATLTTTSASIGDASVSNSLPDTRASSGMAIFSRAIEMATQQMQQTQKILAEMRESMSSIVATGSRVVAGDLGPTPIGTTLDIMQSVTREVNNIQTTMKQINNEFNRAIAAGTRSIVGSGQIPKQYGNEDANNLSDMLVTGLNELTEQLDRLQSAFNTLSNEVATLAARTVNRIVTPSSPSPHHSKHHKLVKRADALVVNGLQRAAGEITQNLGALGGTLARIAGGMTGIRIPGSGVGLPAESTGNRNVIDESQRAFSGLNPIGVIGRGVGNIANSISRIVPSTSGK